MKEGTYLRSVPLFECGQMACTCYEAPSKRSRIVDDFRATGYRRRSRVEPGAVFQWESMNKMNIWRFYTLRRVFAYTVRQIWDSFNEIIYQGLPTHVVLSKCAPQSKPCLWDYWGPMTDVGLADISSMSDTHQRKNCAVEYTCSDYGGMEEWVSSSKA